MKNIRTGFLAILTIIALSSVTMAQQSDEATATANATVLQQIDVDQESNLQFGNVSPGNAKSITPSGVVGNFGVSSGTEGAAIWSVSKGADSEVTVALTTPENLSDNNSNSLLVDFESGGDDGDYAVLATTNDAENGTSFDATGTAPITQSTGDYSSFYSASSFNVFLGGKVSPTNDQASGTYSGDLTLKVTYN